MAYHVHKFGFSIPSTAGKFNAQIFARRSALSNQYIFDSNDALAFSQSSTGSWFFWTTLTLSSQSSDAHASPSPPIGFFFYAPGASLAILVQLFALFQFACTARFLGLAVILCLVARLSESADTETTALQRSGPLLFQCKYLPPKGDTTDAWYCFGQ